MTATNPGLTEIDEMVLELSDVLNGHGPDAQGDALVRLVAKHIARDFTEDSAETDALRAALLQAFVTAVRERIPVAEGEIAIEQIGPDHWFDTPNEEEADES
jgi:hypothetical protein